MSSDCQCVEANESDSKERKTLRASLTLRNGSLRPLHISKIVTGREAKLNKVAWKSKMQLRVHKSQFRHCKFPGTQQSGEELRYQVNPCPNTEPLAQGRYEDAPT